jgi:FKBP-type peptidyl-prolyl cis-trans isomerase FkpA
MKTTLAFFALSLLSTALLAAAPAETLPSGVKVTHTVDGTGANPKASDAVKVHYRGTLANGTEFDSSYKRGQPATFPSAAWCLAGLKACKKSRSVARPP